jgi:hypothetical protein
MEWAFSCESSKKPIAPNGWKFCYRGPGTSFRTSELLGTRSQLRLLCAGAPICRALKAQFQSEFGNQFGASADACAQFKYNKVSTLVICLRIIRLAQFVQYLEPLARFR